MEELNEKLRQLEITLARHSYFVKELKEIIDMKFIGYISKKMFWDQDFKMMGPDGTKITLPLTKIDNMDINRMVYLNEEDNTVNIETFKQIRERLGTGGLGTLWNKEDQVNRPIINLDTNPVKVK